MLLLQHLIKEKKTQNRFLIFYTHFSDSLLPTFFSHGSTFHVTIHTLVEPTLDFTVYGCTGWVIPGVERRSFTYVKIIGGLVSIKHFSWVIYRYLNYSVMFL